MRITIWTYVWQHGMAPANLKLVREQSFEDPLLAMRAWITEMFNPNIDQIRVQVEKKR